MARSYLSISARERSAACVEAFSPNLSFLRVLWVQQAWRARLIDVGAAVFPVLLPAIILTEP